MGTSPLAPGNGADTLGDVPPVDPDPNRRHQTGHEWPPQQTWQPRPPQPPMAHQPPPRPPVPAKRRRVWPYVVGGLVALILVPLITLGACAAAFSGAAKSAANSWDADRQGGTTAWGQEFTYKSGLGLTIGIPASFTPENAYTLKKGQVAWQATVTVRNGTAKSVSAATVLTSATMAGKAVEEIYETTPPSADIAPGQTLELPFQFALPKGAKGDLQISVAGMFNEPVFFNGTIK